MRQDIVYTLHTCRTWVELYTFFRPTLRCVAAEGGGALGLPTTWDVVSSETMS